MKKAIRIISVLLIAIALTVALVACADGWKKYDVVFESNGGSEVETQKVAVGSLVSYPTAPTKSGYSFDGWYEDESFVKQFSFSQNIITKKTIIYAKWVEVFDVVFESNGGSIVDAQKVVKKNSPTRPAEPIKNGFVFDGWYRDINLNEPFYFGTHGILDNTTIYAKWLKIFDVTFESNGGSAVDTKKVIENKYFNKPTKPSKDGFVFAGWFNDANLTIPFMFDDIFECSVEKITADITIYAKWFEICDVTFDSNGGSAVAAQKVVEGKFASQPTNPSKVNDLLECWCKDAGLTTPFNFETDKITGDTILYAKWKECAIDYFLDFTFIDSSNSAYSVVRKPKVELPESVDLPAEYKGKPVTTIGEDAFFGCTRLKNITIPASITTILDAFWNCTGLKSIIMPASVTVFDAGAMHDLTLYAEAASQPNGWYLVGVQNNFRVTWGYNNIRNNADYDYVTHNNEVYLTKYKGSAVDIVIPTVIDGKTVVSFGGIFSNSATIKSLQISAGVTAIGGNAFNECNSLRSVIIGKGSQLISIGRKAFNECINLASVIFETDSKLTSIGAWSFSGCNSLTNITIPASVKVICKWAFSTCKGLTSIVIPISVTNIEPYAFSYSEKLTIYAEVASQPAGWSNCECPVVWGYKK